MQTMKRLALLVVAFGVIAGARAEHADIFLRLQRIDPATGATKDEVSSQADQDPPPGGHENRPLIKVKAQESLVLQFFFTNTYPHGITKGARVRYFLARVEKVKQKQLPDLTLGCVVEGEFQLNFKPKGKVGARVAFTAPSRGIYLLRVESLNTNSDHEHFSAIDVQVE
jgi:hypothetical protein